MKKYTGRTGTGAEPGPKILIAGMGNILLQDDGVGVHAVKGLPPAVAGEYRTIEVGCAVFDALHLFEWAEKILLIDAMQAGRPPGTVYRVDNLNEMETGTMAASLHEFSVIQALEMIQKDPRSAVAIIGVEPEVIDFGLELSEAVEAALPLVRETAQQIVREWTREFAGRGTIAVSIEVIGKSTLGAEGTNVIRP